MNKLTNMLYRTADHYGWSSQSKQLREEMDELALELRKIERRYNDNPNSSIDIRNDIISELADVKNMVIQIEYLLGASAEVEMEQLRKANRQLERIKTEKSN